MGRPSIDPELMIRMLIIGYCMGVRSERRLCEEVHLTTSPISGSAGSVSRARLPDHSTFSTIEATKMENVLRAEKNATVAKINAAPGDGVAVDAVILDPE